jgi:hypothetical protein
MSGTGIRSNPKSDRGSVFSGFCTWIEIQTFCPDFECFSHLKSGPDIFITSLNSFGKKIMTIFLIKWSRLATITKPDETSSFRMAKAIMAAILFLSHTKTGLDIFITSLDRFP